MTALKVAVSSAPPPVQSKVYNCEIKLAVAGVTSVFAGNSGEKQPASPTVPISRERKGESLECTISSRVVSHAISDLAGRYANCTAVLRGPRED